MAKRKGLPSKFMKLKGTLKSRWAKYKKHLRSLGGKRKSSKKKSSNPKTKTKTITKKVFVTRRAPVAKKAPARKPKRKFTLMGNKNVKTFVYTGASTGAMLLTTAIVNKIPMLENWRPWQRAILQWVAGAGLMWFPKNIIMKLIGGGFTAGGFLTLMVPFLQEQGFTILSGNDDITAGEIAQLKLNHNNSMGNNVYERNSYGINGPINNMQGPIDKMMGPIDVMQGSNNFRSQADY